MSSESSTLIKRVNRGGNFCGHNPLKPCLDLALPSDNRPTFLYEVGRAFRRYFDSPDIFPTLNHAASDRQQRSERREAVIQTVQAILEFLDIASLRVGIPTAQGFQPLKLAVLQARTSLHPRRFERAIQALRQAGIIDISEQYRMRTINGTYVFFPAVRRINRAFFAALGFGHRLEQERLAASKRLKKRAQREQSTLTQMMQYSLRQAADAYKEWRKKHREKMRQEQPKHTTAQRLNSLINLFLADGSPPDEARRRAEDVIKRPPRIFTPA